MKPHVFDSFYKIPFLYLLIALSSGIYVGFIADFTINYLLIISVVLMVFLGFMRYFFKASDAVLLLVYLLFFFLIGYYNIHVSTGKMNSESFIEHCKQEGEVVLEVNEIGNQEKEWVKLTAKIQQFQSIYDTVLMDESVVLFVKRPKTELLPGAVLVCKTTFNKIVNSHNPGEFDAESYWNKKGIRHIAFIDSKHYFIQKNGERSMIASLVERSRIYFKTALEENLSGKNLAIALALILGDKSLIDSEITASFTNTGAMHVLAVSGLHIGIIMQILMVVFGFFPRVISKRMAIFSVVVLMWFYALVTGLSPSVLRAVFMFSVLVVAQLRGKNYSALNTLFFTGFVLLFVSPLTLFDIGFQLSFLAMLGIFLVYKPIEVLFYSSNKLLMKIWQGTAIGFAAQLFTTPLSLYYFHQFPNYFILTNIGLMASSGLILGLGLLLFVVFPIKIVAKFVGIILGFIVFTSLWFIEWVEDLPGAVAYGFSVSFFEVFFAFVLVLFLFFIAIKRWHFIVGYVIAILFIVQITYVRYKHLIANECVIFNARNLIITLKNEQHYYCFYSCKPNEFNKKVKLLVENYRKQLPGPITYYSIHRKNWCLKSKNLYFKIEKTIQNTTLLTVNNKKLEINFRNRAFNSPIQQIAMPWVQSVDMLNLKNGCVRIKI